MTNFFVYFISKVHLAVKVAERPDKTLDWNESFFFRISNLLCSF